MLATALVAWQALTLGAEARHCMHGIDPWCDCGDIKHDAQACLSKHEAWGRSPTLALCIAPQQLSD